jgi:TetR/AcrR family transcriptional regulator
MTTTNPIINPAPAKRTNAEIRNENEVRIIRAAELMFAVKGFHGASMQQIADESGLPKSNVLYYFKSKKNLYRMVLENMLYDWMQASSTFENSDDPKEVITNYVEAKMQLAHDRPFGSIVWAKEIMSGAPVMEEFLSGSLKSWTHERVIMLQRWMDEGKISITDPDAFLYLIWSSTQHYADFKSQIEILNDKQEFSEDAFQDKTKALTQMILGSAGL